MMGAGWLGLVIGVILMALGFFMSGAAGYSGTLNIGLLNDKTNLVMIGGFITVSGTICVVVSELFEKMDKLMPAKENSNAEVENDLDDYFDPPE